MLLVDTSQSDLYALPAFGFGKAYTLTDGSLRPSDLYRETSALGEEPS